MGLNLDYDIDPMWAKENLRQCNFARRNESSIFT